MGRFFGAPLLVANVGIGSPAVTFCSRILYAYHAHWKADLAAYSGLTDTQRIGRGGAAAVRIWNEQGGASSQR
jgi:hypothetical protein